MHPILAKEDIWKTARSTSQEGGYGRGKGPATIFMAISVAVPKDLSVIKTKVAMNLTKRQLVCFGCAAAVGVPLYLALKGVLGTQVSALVMVAAMLPFFFLAMYEKDGFPAEKVLYFMVRQKILTPGIRPYQSENIYRQLEERERLEKEVRYLEEKAKGRARGRAGESREAEGRVELCREKTVKGA